MTSPAIIVPARPLTTTTTDEAMVALWLGRYIRSAHTRRGYAADARRFLDFIGKPLATVTGADINDFAASLTNLASATQARRLSAVKSLIGLLHRQGLIPFDVAAAIQLPAIKDTLIERILTEEAVQRLLLAAEQPRRRLFRPDQYIERNVALLRLLYGAGLRISEVCALRWRDLTPRDDTGQLNVFGKGGKSRPVLIRKALWERVCKLRGQAGPDDAVFRSREGGALHPSQVHRIMKFAVKQAKLPSVVSVHWLRHAHASHALDHDCPVHVLQTTLGHASLTTTTRYSHAKPGDSSAQYLIA